MLSVGVEVGRRLGVCVGNQQTAVMLYYSLDPQFSALIFSVCARHERYSLLPDLLTFYPHPHLTPSDLLPYVHTLGVQVATLADHYECLLTQVRAGSVIFLVGVGSLVCWKLWEHWRNNGSSGASPTPGPSPPTQRPRGILASLLEEDLIQDPDEYEDEDPAFIHGKYFGPDSPCEEVPCDEGSLLSTDLSEASNSEALAHPYHADASASYSAGDGASSSGEDSLPTDEDSDVELFGSNKRVVKRKHKASELLKNQSTPVRCQSTPVRCQSTPVRCRVSKANTDQLMVVPISSGGGRPKIEANRHLSTNLNVTPALSHPLQGGWQSSESSPSNAPSCVPGLPSLRNFTRHQGDGSETPDSEEMVGRRKRHLQVIPRQSVGHDDESCWLADNRVQPEGEEEHHQSSNISSASLSDLKEKMRHRGHRGSVSQDNSLASNLPELVTSPQGSKRFLFKREDSVCSNLSDLAPSECSEMSLDVSVQEDLALKTFSCLDNIEHELDDLKSSVLEMDEEVTKFNSKPNPYTFRTTFSDYSITSGDSRPNSAMEIVNARRSRASFKGLLAPKPNTSSESECVEGCGADISHLPLHGVSGSEPPLHGVSGSEPLLHGVLGSEPEGSYEWDSPKHGWSNAHAPLPLSQLPEIPSEDAESSHASLQDDMMPSLEWDNDCLHQYAEDETAASHEAPLDEVFHRSAHDSFTQLGGFEEYKVVCSRLQLLPDHSSLELDLEEELMSSTGPVTEACDFGSAPMTISIDSAIHSGTGSRSTSSSPLPTGMGHSLLSSSGLASSSEISPATPDSETTGWPNCERRFGPGEFGSKVRRYWSSEESGYMEGVETALDTSLHVQLSPVHEIKEKEGSESSSSTPLHRANKWDTTFSEGNINDTTDNKLNNNLIMGNKSSTANDNDLVLRQNSELARIQDTHVAVGLKIELTKYASTEWQGNTSKAQIIRQGYSAIPVELGFTHLRKVRGDNYCGVRAALYQMLSLGLPLPSGHVTHSCLTSELSQGATWLYEWSFGHRLDFTKEQILSGIWECLDALDNMVLSLMGCENRECVVLSHLNGDPDLDVKLCEAIKLHMLAAAINLHTDNNNGSSVPLFAMIMFARHSSLTPKDLLKNHLNPVGDTAGLEQIEMFLMGHTLGVTLQVVRPSSYGKDDFICYYPDANIGVWPEVTLVAEDDRHYNVLVK
ncbi:uncharacterized protein [Panulirus ornatus]|uniref:uncharacterized protein isoform X3 n=1 Tax=Panulirus ornatus TaxID=150431 RepID=UPI003A8989B4